MKFRIVNSGASIAHHGILGQKWGVRNGPPYPLGGGDYTPTEKKKVFKARAGGNSIYNKKHFDTVLKADEQTLRTLSYDTGRTTDTDMFYAATNFFDKHQYNALFNKPIEMEKYDKDGVVSGTQKVYKYAITNKLAADVKVASEDSGAEIFAELYKNDRNFYNFVTDENRMQSYFVEDKYKFRGYREARAALDRIRASDEPPNEEDVKTLYRMFNYVIPYMSADDPRSTKDVKDVRNKYFEAAKDAGYGALLDTNDAIYGGFKTKQPVIIFDMEQIIPDKILETDATSVAISSLITIGRKALSK